MSSFNLYRDVKSWHNDIVHYMCEYRIWTKSDEQLISMFFLPNHGVNLYV